jgi:hypothetical protein
MSRLSNNNNNATTLIDVKVESLDCFHEKEDSAPIKVNSEKKSSKNAKLSNLTPTLSPPRPQPNKTFQSGVKKKRFAGQHTARRPHSASERQFFNLKLAFLTEIRPASHY